MTEPPRALIGRRVEECRDVAVLRDTTEDVERPCVRVHDEFEPGREHLGDRADEPHLRVAERLSRLLDHVTVATPVEPQTAPIELLVGHRGVVTPAWTLAMHDRAGQSVEDAALERFPVKQFHTLRQAHVG